jgi:hypothetical protein
MFVSPRRARVKALENLRAVAATRTRQKAGANGGKGAG